MPATAPALPHGVAAHELVLLLETDLATGLPVQEAAERLRRYGPNRLPRAAPEGVLRRFGRQLRNPLVVVLLAAASVTLALGQLVDTAVVLGVVVVNAVVGFVQESKAEAALDALRRMVATRATVLRDGRQVVLDAAGLVPGDLVLVAAGDKVPADVRLTRAEELAADESALTGESLPVRKAAITLPEGTAVADRRNMLHSGTLVTQGSGAGVVVATGAQTELGEIHRLVGSAEDLATPLTRVLARFSRLLTVVILVLAAVTFGLGLVQGRPVADTFTAAVALAVGAIPEGLPAAVTITLAIGVSRMARRRAVVRRLPAVETLGSTTVICSDKTGTLTENQMTVQALWTPQRSYRVSGTGYDGRGEVRGPDDEPVAGDDDAALHWCLTAGAACNDASISERGDGGHVVAGDPTEAAMLVAAHKGGLPPRDVARRHPRTGTLPFSSQRQWMATVHAGPGARPGRDTVLVKGSAERVLAMCRAQMAAGGGTVPLDADAAAAAADRLAGDGLRVLATAVGWLPAGTAVDEAALDGRLVLTGMQAMLDPPRPAAAAALRSCRSAGVDVKMVTGDHARTATAIATRLGLLDAEPAPGQVLEGSELAALPDAERPAAAMRAAVIARVSPGQKVQLVRALQSQRQVVAMTGDGVNDAPALRQADIGVAMGRGGTEVAQEAADIVLTDDDFATIEAAVEEGRGVFDNLTKFLVWTLPTNMGEGLVILAAVLAGTALPILPTQILWINMTTAVLLGLTLAFEPREPGTMTRPPREPSRPLLTRGLVLRTLLVASLLVAGSWSVFRAELADGAGLAEARTAAVNVFVAVEILYLFSCRSLTRAAWRLGPLGNRWLLAGVGLQVLGQAALTYLPAMHALFHTAAIDAGAWLRVAGVAVLTAAVVAVDKRLRRGVL